MCWPSLRRNGREKQTGPASVAKNATENRRWWNRTAEPKFAAAELSAGDGQHATVNMSGSEHGPARELPARNVQRGVKGNSRTQEGRARIERTGGGVEGGLDGRQNNGLARVDSWTSLEILEEARSLAAGQETTPRGGHRTTEPKILLVEDQLAALAGAFAPPPQQQPPPVRTGPWQYR